MPTLFCTRYSLERGVCACEMNTSHTFPYVWLCSLAFWITDVDDHRVWSASLCFAFGRSSRPSSQTTPSETWRVCGNSDLGELAVLCAGLVHARVHSGRVGVASGATVGLMFGYLWYLVVHDAVHRRHLRRGSLLYRAKMHHALHHHGKVPGNFGVTSSFWDHIFGTLILRQLHGELGLRLERGTEEPRTSDA